jgi:hypothetical protein
VLPFTINNDDGDENNVKIAATMMEVSRTVAPYTRCSTAFSPFIPHGSMKKPMHHFQARETC